VTTQANSGSASVVVASGLTWLPMGSGSLLPSPEADAFLLPSPDEAIGADGVGMSAAGAAVGGSSPPAGVSAMASGAVPGEELLLVSLTYGNGLVLQQSYTSDGDLNWLSLVDPANPSAPLLGRLHDRGDQLDLTSIWDQVANANTQTFAYTDADRLQSGAGPWGTLSYGYDATGNHTSEALVSGGAAQSDAYAYVPAPTVSTTSTGTETFIEASPRTPPATSWRKPDRAPATPISTIKTDASARSTLAARPPRPISMTRSSDCPSTPP
jgi:hypothetical protein